MICPLLSFLDEQRKLDLLAVLVSKLGNSGNDKVFLRFCLLQQQPKNKNNIQKNKQNGRLTIHKSQSFSRFLQHKLTRRLVVAIKKKIIFFFFKFLKGQESFYSYSTKTGINFCHTVWDLQLFANFAVPISKDSEVSHQCIHSAH